MRRASFCKNSGAWDKVGELFSGFVKDKPDNPTVVSALYWIGKAKAHEGKIDEAKQLAADTIKKYIADQSKDAVEQLITQLAQLCVKKKPRSPRTLNLAQMWLRTLAPALPRKH